MDLIPDIDYQIMVQRATQAVIWAMPAVAMIDIEKATQKDLGGNINDVVYFSKPLDSKHGFLTANDVTAYAIGSLSTEKGPLVVEVPAATDKVSYFGTFVNAWDIPIEDVGPPGKDKGNGGKYLFLPPGYDGEIPEGYLVYPVDTYSVNFAFRPVVKNGATEADVTNYAKSIKIYYLADAADPTATNYLDAYPKYFNTLPTYDLTYFEDIYDVVNREPVLERDKVAIAMLKDIGIEKGKPFAPSDDQKRAMTEGLKLAWASMQSFFTTPGKAMIPYWQDKQWQIWNFPKGQSESGFPYVTHEKILMDERAGGAYFWITYLPKYLGGGTFYLTGLRDRHGNMFDGRSIYKLNVPADTPAKDFWSVIVYSMQSKGFIQDAPFVGLSAHNKDTLQFNEDGSADIYFAPEAPQGMESNWIPTGEDFFLLFRLYGPNKPLFEKTWSLQDVEKVA